MPLLPIHRYRHFAADCEAIRNLPETRFEPFVPDWQTIDWNSPDIGADDADAIARDIETIRNLPQI